MRKSQHGCKNHRWCLPSAKVILTIYTHCWRFISPIIKLIESHTRKFSVHSIQVSHMQKIMFASARIYFLDFIMRRYVRRYFPGDWTIYTVNNTETLCPVYRCRHGPSPQLFDMRTKRLNISLLIETAVVTIAAILAIRVFSVSSVFKQTWFVAPCILIAAALVPTAIKRRNFARIDLNNKKIGHSLVLLGWACIATFPATFCGLWLMRYWGLELPLRSVMPPAQGWFNWLLYQFMYVSVAEEIFFRGYVQNNILRLTGSLQQERRRLLQWMSIIISAACFAAAHTIVQGEIISVLTFLPGLVLGWLFVRTRSLLAPILFHGLANVFYLCVAAMVV